MEANAQTAADELARVEARGVLAFREELSNSSMSEDEIAEAVQAFAGRSQVELVKPIELWSDQELEEEAERRALSWLSVESDADLMREVAARQLLTRKDSLTEEEFEQEAERRGFYSSLAAYPIEEIQAYLRMQGHAPKPGGSQNNGRRSGKKRQKNRRGNNNGHVGNHH